MVIDSHVHIFHDFTDETARSYLRKVRELGIEGAVACAIGETIVPGTNEWYAQQISRHSDFFVGLANVDLDGSSPDELAHLTHAPFVGFKVLFGAKPYGHPDYLPLWGAMQALNRPVLVHTGWLAMSPRTRRINMLNLRPMEIDFVARNFPDLRIVMAHMGNPWFEEAYCVLKRQANVFADLSGGAQDRSVAFWQDLFAPDGKVDIGSLSKLLWASDHGYLGATLDSFECIAFHEKLFEACRVPQDIRDRVCRGNARELFGIGEH